MVHRPSSAGATETDLVIKLSYGKTDYRVVGYSCLSGPLSVFVLLVLFVKHILDLFVL